MLWNDQWYATPRSHYKTVAKAKVKLKQFLPKKRQ